MQLWQSLIKTQQDFLNKESILTPFQKALLEFAYVIEDNLDCPYPTPGSHIVTGDWYHKLIKLAKEE